MAAALVVGEAMEISDYMDLKGAAKH